ncbi:polar amino acid transport system substrate-binding protein [Parvibaculum indicum]|uniref:transporter substrate-binding domain-containing protein n=1 Tax=Parvibaculum indicum TaxID=562969 RepID=UPI00141D8D74|nr:transporter substrate-binding domain-containing protein [Parvibaculum indicum]NIJ42880.1 polar amino acid transport system substrate-binding protein [Parvibaculum indicum]
MRFLAYLNLLAIILIAGGLARHYEGTKFAGPAHREAPREAAESVDMASVGLRASSVASGTAQKPGKEQPAATDESLPPEPVPDEPLPHGVPLVNPRLDAAKPAEVPTERAAPPEKQAEPPLVLTVLTEGDYPPFNYRDDAGELTGFDVDLAHALCDRLGAQCDFETRAWGALLPALKSGAGDVVIASMLIPSPPRAAPPHDEDIVFTGAYYSTPGRFAVVKSGGFPSSAAGLAGKRVAVQAGSVHAAFLAHRFPGIEAVDAATLKDAEQALAQGRVDYLFGDRNALLRWLGTDGTCCRLAGPDYADPAWFGEGAGIALRREDEALRKRIDDALAGLVADGTYRRISSHYFSQSIY